jgi:MFS family permease
MFTTGAFFGAAFAGPSGDYLGRRLTIATGALIFCLGGSLQTGAQNIHFLWSGRFFAGLGVGKLSRSLGAKPVTHTVRVFDNDRAALSS